MKQALDNAGLDLVCSIHTTSDWSQFRYKTSGKVQDHIDSFKSLAEDALIYQPLHLNSHSGCDSWTIDQTRQFLRGALEVEKSLNTTIVHETHRRRIFWNPFNFRDVLKNQPDLEKVLINLDISHWVCVLERIFGSETSLHENGPDEWWPEILEMVNERTFMIHARVGYAEGPQIADPTSPEYSSEVSQHLVYWEEAMKGMISNNRICFVEPEHGPWPYQQVAPHSNMTPVVDIWKANNHVAKLVRERFSQFNP